MTDPREQERIGQLLVQSAQPRNQFVRVAQATGAPQTASDEDENEWWLPEVFGPHDYTRTHELCDPSEDEWCDADNANRVLKLYAAPGRLGFNEVEEGDSTFILPLGWVDHEVDEDTGTVSNIAEWHLLAPGRIDRRVIEKDGKFYIETHGTGDGLLPELNERYADWLWGENVDRMRDRLEDDYD